MVHSYSEAQYDKFYKELCECVPDSVIKYFNNNWHAIRHEWSKYALVDTNFLNDTNNKLEALNGVLKDKIGRDLYFLEFTNEFFIYLDEHYCNGCMYLGGE